MSVSEISKLELGVRPLRVEHLEKLGAAIGVEARQLVHADQMVEIFAEDPASPREPGGASGVGKLPVFGRAKGNRLVELRVESGVADPFGHQDASDLFAVPMPTGELNHLVPRGSILVVSRSLSVREGDLVLRVADDQGTVAQLRGGDPKDGCLRIISIWLR